MNSELSPNICSVCHIGVQPEYYFCPNCGNNLHPKPLSTSISTQIGIYLFSAILPSICFIMVTRWPGLKYYRSEDKKAKIIGIIAWVILIISTVITYWLAYIWTKSVVDGALNSASLDLSGYSL